MHRRAFLFAAASPIVLASLPAKAEKTLPIYNLVGTFMNWNRISDAYAAKTGVRPTLGLRSGSSPALVAMRMEAANPQASGSYWSLDIAVDAKNSGVTAPYSPNGIEHVPADLRDPDGHWWAIASANVVIGTNNDVLERRGLSDPTSYADLLKPEYAGLCACMDPTWSGTASVFLYGINFVLGGTRTDFRPGMNFAKAYVENGQQFRSELIAPRLATGDVALSLDAEGNVLLSKATGAPLSVSVPEEGVVGAYLGMSVAKGAPMQAEVEAFMDWLLSEEAQALIAEGYFRPVRTDAIPVKIAAELPKIDNVVKLDIQHQAAVVSDLKRAFVDIVQRDGDVDTVLGRYGLAG
ncbi:extracellular solute-binding protein [Mesorhizobium sp. 1B3]|uniref:extracellular solute-binding protein n=1 Tax=Mesorhizobium sp. 1B3 TaxID=3243599 RepID=UPI003D95DCBE